MPGPTGQNLVGVVGQLRSDILGDRGSVHGDTNALLVQFFRCAVTGGVIGRLQERASSSVRLYYPLLLEKKRYKGTNKTAIYQPYK